MREIINKFVGLSGYQIKRSKYLYDPFQNLIKSINYFKVKSIIDVGANKGQFVNKLLKNGFNGNVLSFEPLSDEHNYLKKISKNKNKWDIEERCALGKRNSKEKIYVSGNSESSSLLKILPKHTDIRPDSKTVDTQEIYVKKLNNFKNKIYKLEKNILLKIDCQGSEMDVLIGANKIIKSFSCIFLEVSLVNLYQKQKLWLEIINYLKKINFEVWSVDQLLKNNKTGQTYQLDIFFYKKNKI